LLLEEDDNAEFFLSGEVQETLHLAPFLCDGLLFCG